MRADMDKVIVERPRWGSRAPSRKKGYRKYIERTAVENLPRREPMLGRWKGLGRSLNEHLGPMRRFLRSRVGRPWDKVHQELCEHVSFENAVQKHVLTHVFDYVARNVEVRGDLVFAQRLWGGRSHALRPGEMYICPRTGLLQVVRRPRGRSVPVRIDGGPLRQFHRRDGAWWEVRLQKLPADREGMWDVWLERKLELLQNADCVSAYGGKLFAISKRPLTRAETRDLYRRLRKVADQA